jgi:hypothetical protein
MDVGVRSTTRFLSFDSPAVDTLYRVVSVGDEKSTEYDQNLIYGLKV